MPAAGASGARRHEAGQLLVRAGKRHHLGGTGREEQGRGEGLRWGGVGTKSWADVKIGELQVILDLELQWRSTFWLLNETFVQ